jgi:glucose/mannose-6-phosphate isomerase
MKELIEAFSQNIRDAIQIANSSTLTTPKNEIKNIIICGLGGSGIGAKIVHNWTQDEINVPITCVNEYTLPAFANENTLVIGCSYSGNTEETTMAIDEAHANGCHIVGITSGGNLQAFCAKFDYDCIIVPGGNPPRSALAFSLVQLLHYLAQQGFISPLCIVSINNAADALSKDLASIQSIGMELANFLYKKVGVYYAETKYEGVIVRARQQFNENSKYLGWHHVIPEMNHNELVGWGGGDERFAPVFFNTVDMHPRNKKRFQITLDAVQKKSGNVFIVDAKGENLIERSIYFIHIVDWASFYLCELNKADIMDIEIIDYLKSELAQF